MKESRPPNALSGETSPYLLQHAYNPVNWYPWGEEALNRALSENKPILVSIGYSACHWCHVMERESFEDPGTARIMNEHFINIKIDREERPDLDQIYMDAVQAMTGAGGWPLNVFLTPGKKPFFGGTYFPPVRAYNRASWKETLSLVSEAFTSRRDDIEHQAEQLTAHLLQANSFGMQKDDRENHFHMDALIELYRNLIKLADPDWGGFGRAPKFPQTFSIRFLLRYYFLTGEKQSVNQALVSLDKMAAGGIYDHIGGGFARYATDTEWFLPHFEKMLYDNALLVSSYAEAYQLTRQDHYRDVIRETLDFVHRELMDPGYGFYAALDADSEGEEGRFYVWDQDEIISLLGEERGHLFCELYDISKEGNWEGKNIPNRQDTLTAFAPAHEITEADLKKMLLESRAVLLNARDKRVRPGLDDKILLGWNALMNTALSQAYAATGEETYKESAIRNMEFMLHAFRDVDGHLLHTWKAGVARYPAFLDDYAGLIRALINLQEITGNTQWLEEARKITGLVLDQFSDEDGIFFYYTGRFQKDVLIRKKEMYDGATPSGNALMATNLHHLSIYFDLPEWRERARAMVGQVTGALIRYPNSFGVWASLFAEMLTGTYEWVLVAGVPDIGVLRSELLETFFPYRVLMSSSQETDNYPLLKDKKMKAKPFIYNCRNYVCQRPVSTVGELWQELGKSPKI